jgi:hypothetical protein
MSDTEPTQREMKLMRNIVKNMSKVIVSSLKLQDQNGDGFLSAAELLVQSRVKIHSPSAPTTPAKPQPFDGQAHALPNYEIEPSSVIVDDGVIFTRAAMGSSVSETYKFSPDYVDTLIGKAFPKGVADVMLSDACSSYSELQCMPLPNGKVIRFSEASKGS